MANVAETRQTDRRVDLVFAPQAAKGTLAGASTGIRVPFSSHNGFTHNQVRSPDPRNSKNGMTKASLLNRKLYELSNVSFPVLIGEVMDPLIQGMQRATFTAEATLTQSDISQIQTVSAGGLVTFTASPITAGVRVGDCHTYASGVDTADRNKAFIVTAVTATTIQYHKAMTAVASATDFSLTVLKFCGNGTERWPLTIEDTRETSDAGETGDFAVLNSVTISSTGNSGLLEMTCNWLIISVSEVSGAGSPHFTTVSETTSQPITPANVDFILNGTEVPYESFTFTWNLNTSGDETNNEEYLDLAHGNTVISGSFQVLEDSTANSAFTSSLSDSFQSVGFVATDPDGNHFGTYMARCKFPNPGKTPPGNDRFTARSFEVEVSEDERGGGYRNTMATMFTSDVS